MEKNNIYEEIKNWFENSKDIKAGMRLHAKYQKNKSKILKIASDISNRKRFLEIYLKEILNQNKPIGVPVIKNFETIDKIHNVETKQVFKKSFQERLQEEFPKLIFGQLPDELKLLVYKRYDAWEKSKQFHAKQQNAQSEEERFEAVKNTVNNIKINWAIWEELDYYQKYGKMLGKHPDFKKNEFEEKIKELEKLPPIEFALEMNRLRKNIRNRINDFIRISKTNTLTVEQEQLMNEKIKNHDYISLKIGKEKWYEGTETTV